MLALVTSRALSAANAPKVSVEVHLANGLPGFTIVGLADTEVRESRERVRAALQYCGFAFPAQRITVNLAPADLPKDSGRFDLPIALGILVASAQLPEHAVAHATFVGELSLTGALRPIRGAFAMACGVADEGAVASLGMSEPSAARCDVVASRRATLFLPEANAAEAAYVPGIAVYAVRDLPALCDYLHRRGRPSDVAAAKDHSIDGGTPHIAGRAAKERAHDAEVGDVAAVRRVHVTQMTVESPGTFLDMADVIGQPLAKRALEIAAAGAHHVLMTGPPGAGKSMLAARLPGILPPMTDAEALASAALLSRGPVGFSPQAWRQRPFRSPHHSSSPAALIGGGNPPRPGEVTLAHHGVLFLDELPEFERRTLEMLREPLETGVVTVSRAGAQAAFPAGCQLVAAMNPCPCGWAGDASGRCQCTPDQTARYQRKLSGPLLDRIDIQLTLTALSPHELTAAATARAATSSADIRRRVARARSHQWQRQQAPNAQLQGDALHRACPLTPDMRHMLEKAMVRFHWTARTYDRVRRISRTIADLADHDYPTSDHLAEAIQYRRTGAGN